jgi:crotonobetainyl-CoA:carnitine CoA-transferase CaiB-like acyl-CoA transferase
VQTYDIVLEQFRPGVMERLGVGYAALRAANPRLIYCAISAYGQTGPYRDRVGHDINLVAQSGIASHSGYAASGPPPLGVQIADVGSSFTAITGLLAAVIHRQRTGEGQLVDVSMFDAALSWNVLAASQYLVGGVEPTREAGMLNGGGFYGYYRTRDDGYLAVGSLEPKFWMGFCRAIGRPDLVDLGYDPDPDAQARLKAALDAAIGERTLDEWRAVFAPLDLCVEPVLTTGQACAHPQTQARAMVVDVPKPEGGVQRQIGAPIRFSAGEPIYRHVGATLGEHTVEIMGELGYSDAEIAEMRRRGLFG